MNKLGIWAIAIVAAFVIGVLSANPVAEAVGGWKEALQTHEGDSSAHHDKYTDAEAIAAVGPHTLPNYWEIVDKIANSANALCDLGDKVIGGGTTVLGGATEVTVGEPIFDGGTGANQEGWKGALTGGGSFQIRVSASCLDNPPLRS